MRKIPPSNRAILQRMMKAYGHRKDRPPVRNAPDGSRTGTDSVTRVEIIGKEGRIARYDDPELDLQDGGRTLKVFLNEEGNQTNETP